MSDFATRRMMMVDTQVRPSDVTKLPIIEAMLQIPREAYVPDNRREAAYVGENLDLGSGRFMLDPRSLAKILDALDIRKGDLALDLGCGLGYSAAVLARLADTVVAVEPVEGFAEEAQRILSEQGIDNAVVIGGELAAGCAKHAPFDVILIEGGVEEVPEAVLDQLAEGGRIAAIFVEEKLGTVRVGYKVDGRIAWRSAFHAAAPILAGFEKERGFTF